MIRPNGILAPPRTRSASSSLSSPRMSALASAAASTTITARVRPPCLAPSHAPRRLYTSRGLATFAPPPSAESTALQVTDPLLIYRAKVARGELEEDEEQLRALVELRRINRVLRDYVPPAHLLGILNQDSRSAQPQSAKALQQQRSAAQPDADGQQHADDAAPPGQQKIGELVRWLSDSEGLAELGTPKGLMITGTPGTGKSMVMDIFYDSLPTPHKFRRHYHHLLLDLYKIIWEEAERRRIALRYGGPRNTVAPRRGLGGVWVRESRGNADADDPSQKKGWRRMLEGMPFMRYDSLEDGAAPSSSAVEIPGPDGDVVKTTLPLHAAAHLFLRHGHILLFDEIQLVDVASAGLLRRTLEAYWRLGGVVIGTSNRIPKDLYASNVQRGQLTQFLEMLGERCPNFEMRKTRDFRREPFYRQEWLERKAKQEQQQQQHEEAEEASTSEHRTAASPNRRATYFVRGEEDLYRAAVDDAIRGRQGVGATVQVYGRKVHVPFSIVASEAGPSVCRFTFEQLCDSPLGPADYLTLASTYHTFIIDRVPQLTLMQKNQARRLITLLDAVYEAGCRLVLLADSSPDDLFFPDAKAAASHAAKGAVAGPGPIVKEVRDGLFWGSSGAAGEADDVVDMSANGGVNPFKTPPPGRGYPDEEALEQQRRQQQQQRVDAGRNDEFLTDSLIQMETLSEALQDTEEGFRPNILPYESRPDRTTGAAELRRLQQQPSTSSSSSSSPAGGGAEMEAEQQQQRELSDKVGFKHLAIFSGEDERFAYQRAVSRLFEMSHPDWVVRKSWRPFLEQEMDSWRGSEAEKRERRREQGLDPDAAAGSGSAAVAAAEQTVREELDEGHAHLSRVQSTLHHLPTLQRDASAPASATGSEGDFADEASYESSTYPSRTANPVYWSADEARLNDQPNRGASNAALPPDGRPDFSPGPVGRRNKQGLPVLSEVHFWGVREDWGAKAGVWGKGARVFEIKQEEGEGGKKAGSRRRLGKAERTHNSAGVGGGGRRSFSTTARRGDHYKTLQLTPSASKAQIKAQFYKLSKQWHPDVNPSDDAKKQFQKVSEAYATLGSEDARRKYDRQASPSSSFSGPSTPYGYSYDPTSNASRRARATYAWNARKPKPSHHSSTSSPYGKHPSHSASSGTTFETHAERQRRREEILRSRAQGYANPTPDKEKDRNEAEGGGGIVRFLQMGALLLVIFKAGTIFT